MFDRIRSPKGLTTQYQYDIFGRLTSVVLPPVADPRNNNVVVNPTTTYQYDIYGDMTQIKDAIANNPAQSGDNLRVTSFTFDQYRHQTSHTLPALQTPPPPAPKETESYDTYGRLSSQTHFAGNTTVFAYDTLGRLHSKTLTGALRHRDDHLPFRFAGPKRHCDGRNYSYGRHNHHPPDQLPTPHRWWASPRQPTPCASASKPPAWR